MKFNLIKILLFFIGIIFIFFQNCSSDFQTKSFLNSQSNNVNNSDPNSPELPNDVTIKSPVTLYTVEENNNFILKGYKEDKIFKISQQTEVSFNAFLNGNKIYYDGSDETNGVEPWVYHIDTNKTELLEDMRPGKIGGYFYPLLFKNEKLYFGSLVNKIFSLDNNQNIEEEISLKEPTSSALGCLGRFENKVICYFANSNVIEIVDLDNLNQKTIEVKRNGEKYFFVGYPAVIDSKIYLIAKNENTQAGLYDIIWINPNTSEYNFLSYSPARISNLYNWNNKLVSVESSAVRIINSNGNVERVFQLDGFGLNGALFYGSSLIFNTYQNLKSNIAELDLLSGNMKDLGNPSNERIHGIYKSSIPNVILMRTYDDSPQASQSFCGFDLYSLNIKSIDSNFIDQNVCSILTFR